MLAADGEAVKPAEIRRALKVMAGREALLAIC
jgi:hypothetical protein